MYRLFSYKYEYHNYAYWEDGFSVKELDDLQNLAKSVLGPANVGKEDGHGEDLGIRRTKVGWIEQVAENIWVYDKIGHITNVLNSRFFNFDIDWLEQPQLGNYLAEDRGTYDWHMDQGSPKCRKLSFVMQLTDPLDYEGGELLLQLGSTPVTIPKKRGLVTVFPSYILHKVTEVTQGSRQSLVCWINGPAFR
jgi:PKHD-type hydroxylase